MIIDIMDITLKAQLAPMLNNCIIDVLTDVLTVYLHLQSLQDLS